MTRNDQRAQELACWLREHGHECTVFEEERCVDACVDLEDSPWHVTLGRDERGREGYFPVRKVGTKLRFLPPVRTKQEVLDLVVGE